MVCNHKQGLQLSDARDMPMILLQLNDASAESVITTKGFVHRNASRLQRSLLILAVITDLLRSKLFDSRNGNLTTM